MQPTDPTLQQPQAADPYTKVGNQLKQRYPQYQNVDSYTLGLKYMKKYGSVSGGSQTNPFSGSQSTPAPTQTPIPTTQPTQAPTATLTQTPLVQAATPQQPSPPQSQPAPKNFGQFFGGLLNNTGQDFGNMFQGVVNLPGAISNAAHQGKLGELGGNVVKGVLNEYNDLVGQPVNPQTGNLQMPDLSKAANHAYEHPLNTVLDVLPVTKALEALGLTGKGAQAAEEAGNAAKAADATSSLKTPMVGPAINSASNIKSGAISKLFGAGELKNYAPTNTPIENTVAHFGLEDHSGDLANYARNTVLAQQQAGKNIESALANADAQGANIPLSRLREIVDSSKPAVVSPASQGMDRSAMGTIENAVRKYIQDNNIPIKQVPNGKGALTDELEQGTVKVPTSLVNQLKQNFYKGANFGSANPSPEQLLSRDIASGLRDELGKAVPTINQANQHWWNLQQIGDHLQGLLDQSGKIGGPQGVSQSFNPANALNTVPGQATVAQIASAPAAAGNFASNMFQNAKAGLISGGIEGGKTGAITGGIEQAGRFAPPVAPLTADQNQQQTPTANAALPNVTTTPSPTPEMSFQDLSQKLANEPDPKARKELVSVYKAQFSGKSSNNNAQQEQGLVNTTGLLSNEIAANANALNQATVQGSNLSGVFGQGNQTVQKIQAEVTAYKQAVATTLHKRGMSDQQFKQLDPLFPNPGKDSVQQMQSKMAALNEFMGAFFAPQ